MSVKLQAEVAKAAHTHYQLSADEVEVEVSRELAHGDYATNVALRVASKWGVPPRQAAETIAGALWDSRFITKHFSKVEIAGPGFINFWLNHQALAGELPQLIEAKSRRVLDGQRVVVEYSSPNIAKPMHIGHIRSTIIGQALSNIYEALGARVIRLNHLGDWGTQFGKLIAAYKLWGSRAAVHRHPIEEMLRLYVRFHDELRAHPELEEQGQDEFRKLEEGNRENRSLWNWFKRESLREFMLMYKRLGVKFNYVTGESFYESMLKGVVTDLLKRKIATKNADGSVVVHLETESLPPLLVQKSDGASLYATRDLAAVRYRLKRFSPNLILYVVANQQALHFEQLFACAKRAGYAGKCVLEHVKFGLVLGEDGQKMATREGHIIKLEDVLGEAVSLARKIVDKKNPKLKAKLKARVAEVVGLGAVKYNDLSQNRHTDITFQWDKMLSVEGNSGPYLQYSYVRLRSILRKAGGAGKRRGKIVFHKIHTETLAKATAADLGVIRTLIRYPDAIARAAKENGPHLLAGYVYELANAMNSFYHEAPVLTAAPALKNLRLTLVNTAAEVLKQGLGILGIEVVEQM